VSALHCISAVIRVEENDLKPFLSMGGHVAVLRTMERHSGFEDVCVSATDILAGLAIKEPAFGYALYRAGSTELLISAMGRYSQNPALILSGCIGLGSMIFVEAPETKTRVAQEGGIRALISAMKNHPADISIQECGFKFLGLMVCGHFGNARLVGSEGGIDPIIHVMKARLARRPLCCQLELV